MTEQTQQQSTPLRTGEMGLVREAGVSAKSAQTIIDEARGWGMLGFDLEWDKEGNITWIGLGHAGRAVSFWAPTLPDDTWEVIKAAIKDPSLPKLAHNVQAERRKWTEMFGEDAIGGLWEDCHLDSETEFLTLDGWKRFDDVKRGEPIAAFDPVSHRMVFEKPVRRVSRHYTGRLMVLQTQHTRAAVSGNHRLWVQPRKRTAKSWGGTPMGPWMFAKAGEVVAATDTDTFDILMAPAPAVSGIAGTTVHWLTFMALAVTDGSVVFSRGVPVAVRISQIKNGRANAVLDALKDQLASPCVYRETEKRELWRTKKTIECTWTFNSPELAKVVLRTFGRYSRARFLRPATFLKWSQKARRVFFEALFLGDGSRVYKHTWRYCTASKQLAGDVQALALSCGWPATVGRSGSTYEVSVRPDLKGVPRTIRGRETGQNGALKHSRKVKDKRIVCFVMPTGTLITRSKGKPAFHGNTMLIHHAACPGLAHDLQQVTSQFLVVPPWKTWHRQANKEAEEAAKVQAKADKEQAKADAKAEKERERAAAKVAKLRARMTTQCEKFLATYPESTQIKGYLDRIATSEFPAQMDADIKAAIPQERERIKAERKAKKKEAHDAKIAQQRADREAKKAQKKADHEARNAKAKADAEAAKAEKKKANSGAASLFATPRAVTAPETLPPHTKGQK